MTQPTTNIDELHAAIKEDLQAHFDGVAVDFYPRPSEKITTPAILLELEDIIVEDADDIGTEQLPVLLNFNAYAVLDYKTGKKQAVKTLAGDVMAYIRGKRWGQPVGAAICGGASPDVIGGREDDYEVMRVEFSHEALLGVDIWEVDKLKGSDGAPIAPPDKVHTSENGGAFEEIDCDCSQP